MSADGHPGTLGPVDRQIGSVTVDLVLGFSVTTAGVRYVVVEGATGEGATLASGVADQASAVQAAVAQSGLAAAAPIRVRSAGVTWSGPAVVEATALVDALAAAGVEHAVAVPPTEAALALATGVGARTDHDTVAVCITEPEETFVAAVRPDEVGMRTVDGPLDARTLAEHLDGRPEAVFVLGGAADRDELVAGLQDLLAVPVYTTAEADLALARGAALAATPVIGGLAATPPAAGAGAAGLSRANRALLAVVATAAVALVTSASVALTMRVVPDAEQRTAAEPVQAVRVVPQAPAPRPKPAEAVPERAPAPVEPPAAPAPEPASLPAPAPEPVSLPVQPEPAAVPPALEPAYLAPEPAYVPEPVAVAPAPEPAAVPPAPDPAAVPPAPDPAAVPPAQPPGYVPPVPPQPRLRDLIIEKIPILNRFHTPQWVTP